MNIAPELEALRQRKAPLEMQPDEFREIGHRLVDQIADRLATLPDGLVTPDESPADLRRALGAEQTLPPAGTDAGRLVSEATGLLFDHSLFNGHPRFFGYITSSPAPIGMFGDFLAAAAQSERGGVAAGAARDRDRRAGRAVDCRADRVSHQLRRAAGQRRQHGELRLLRRRSRGQGAVGRAKGGAVARRTAIAGLRVDGNPHVDPESRRSVRARHRRHPLDCHRR